LARGFTKRDKILKIEAANHGHADALLVKAGSGARRLMCPTAAGVPADSRAIRHATLNDFAALDNCGLARDACAIIEPIPRTWDDPLKPGFLEKLRKLTQDGGALLFLTRSSAGSAWPVVAPRIVRNQADLTTLGKIHRRRPAGRRIGGRADVMDLLAPTGPVYQAGTTFGQPVAMAAGIATLEENSRKVMRYGKLERRAAALGEEWKKDSEGTFGAPRLTILHIFYRPRSSGYASAKTSDTKRYASSSTRCSNVVSIWRHHNLEIVRVPGAHGADIEHVACSCGSGEDAMKIVVAMTGASGAIYTQRLSISRSAKTRNPFHLHEAPREVGQIELPKVS